MPPPPPPTLGSASPTSCRHSTCRALVLTAGSAPQRRWLASSTSWTRWCRHCRPIHTASLCMQRWCARAAGSTALAGVVDAQYLWPWVPRRRAPWKACSLPASGAARGLSSPRCTVQAFFTRWWAQQDDDMRAAVSQLVRSGQASGSVCECAAGRGVVMRQCFHLCMCGPFAAGARACRCLGQGLATLPHRAAPRHDNGRCLLACTCSWSL